MPLLLRKTKKDMFDNNKVQSYWLVAVIEVFLVVFGILIAFQVDEWKEEKEKRRLRVNYKEYLIKDLEADIASYEEKVQILEKNLNWRKAWLQKINEGFSTKQELIDYMIEKEKDAVKGYTSLKSVNNSTFQSIISSAHLSLFSQELGRNLNQLNTLQEETITTITGNAQITIIRNSDFLNEYFPFIAFIRNPKFRDDFYSDIDIRKFLKASTSNFILSIEVESAALEKLKVLSEKTKESLELVKKESI